MGFTLITVTGKYVFDNGTVLAAATGTVTFTLTDPLQDPGGNQILSPADVVATLDGTGAFSVKLAATDDTGIIPTGVTYAVTERVGGAHRQFNMVVPAAGGPIDMADVMPILPTGSLYPYALVSYVDAQVKSAKSEAVAMALVLGG